jgi:hypothetical protein
MHTMSDRVQDGVGAGWSSGLGRGGMGDPLLYVTWPYSERCPLLDLPPLALLQNGDTPLILAASSSAEGPSKGVVKQLLDAGAAVDAADQVRPPYSLDDRLAVARWRA